MPFPAVIELSDIADGDGSTGFVIIGIKALDRSGWSVASAGDVNGDGIDDLIIGAPERDSGDRLGNGAAYVVFGSADGFAAALNLSALDGSNGFVINGVDGGEQSGYSVASAGDVNGDGIDDLIIGAPGGDPGGRIDAGETYVVFGSAAGFADSLELSTLDGSNGFVINGINNGDATFDQSGWSVAGAGDVNGDGIGDLIIGAPTAASGGDNFAGETYVVFGSADGFAASLDLSALDGGNGFAINGIDAFDHSGQSVASAGDINGDGIDDLIIGADDADPVEDRTTGETYVVFGSAGGFAANLDLSALDGGNGFAIPGIEFNDNSGYSVASAGDVNGDGIDDLIIGAYKADPGGDSFAGETYVVFGSATGFAASLDLSALDGSNGFTINGIDADDESGWSVASAGDVNGDGIDDLIISARNANPGGRSNAGESYVVFGRPGDFAAELDLSALNGSNGFIINGIDTGDRSGWSVASAGDVNGDGIDDLIIGVPYADPGGRRGAGETYIIYGRRSNQVEGTGGDDTLIGTRGIDTLNGLGGNDTLNGRVGSDLLYGEEGDDQLDGGRGTDELRGGDGNDTLFGGYRTDVVFGEGGNDRLFGEQINDTLSGGSGNDSLNGGDGADTMTGGADADIFEFLDGDMKLDLDSSDFITDFSQAEGDTIDLSGIDAIAASPEIDSFAFIGESAFTGNAGELRYVHRDGWTVVYGDTDGDGVRDFTIRLDGTHDLVASDFAF